MGKYQFSTQEFAILVGRKQSTVYSWAYTGRLIPQKDFCGRNIFTEEDYEKVMGKPFKPEDHSINQNPVTDDDDFHTIYPSDNEVIQETHPKDLKEGSGTAL